MSYNPDIHHRKSIRLKGYDYSKEGLYFITICTQNREHLFGEIVDDKMILNNAGQMIDKIWFSLKDEFKNIDISEYVIMPNHFHCIIEIKIVGAESISAQDCGEQSKRADIESAPTGKPNIPKIIQTFKRHTTIEYIKMVKDEIVPPFEKQIWQRNYYENIIRNEKQYIMVSEYIKNNPLKWTDDKYYEE
jgi:REP element-mobilizing transposase RayT